MEKELEWSLALFVKMRKVFFLGGGSAPYLASISLIDEFLSNPFLWFYLSTFFHKNVVYKKEIFDCSKS